MQLTFFFFKTTENEEEKEEREIAVFRRGSPSFLSNEQHDYKRGSCSIKHDSCSIKVALFLFFFLISFYYYSLTNISPAPRNSKMAGSALAITVTNKERENHERNLQIAAVTDEWKVEYARFINCSSSALKSMHPSLEPVPKNRHHGNWISATTAASIKLIYERSPAGTDDAVFVLSLGSKILVRLKISSLSSCF